MPLFVGIGIVALLASATTVWALLPAARTEFEAGAPVIEPQLGRYFAARRAVPTNGNETSLSNASLSLRFEGDRPNADFVDLGTVMGLESGHVPSASPLLGGRSWLARLQRARDVPEEHSASEAAELIDRFAALEYVLLVGVQVREGEVRDLDAEARARMNNAPHAPAAPVDPDAIVLEGVGAGRTAATASTVQGWVHLVRLADASYLGSVPVRATAHPLAVATVLTGGGMPSAAEQVESQIRHRLIESAERQVLGGLRAGGVQIDALP
jgi:hypothetical protein